MSFIRLGLARLRDERGGSLAFVLVVFVTAFLFSIWPRLYDRTKETALRSEVAAAPSSHRNIELSRQARIAGEGGIIDVARAGDQEEGRLPQEVRALIEARTLQVDSPRWLPVEPILWTTVILRIQDGLEERVRYVHGGPPAAAAAPEGGADGLTFEAALSVRAAERLGVTAEEVDSGERMELRHDPTDTAARAGSTTAVRFTGIFEPTIPLEDDYWFDDPSAIVPRVRAISADDSFHDVAVIVATEAYTSLVQPSAGPAFDLRYAWRYFIAPGRLAVDSLDHLAADLRSMEGIYRDRDTQTGDATVNALRSRLLTLVESHISSWSAADVTLVTAGIGPVGLAGGAVGFIAVLSALRRTRQLRAAHARGATTSQMVAVTLAECLLLAVPAAVLAGLLAIALVPAPRWETTAVGAGAVAIVTASVLVVAVAVRFGTPTQRRPGRLSQLARHRRLLLEATVVALAVGGTILLLERGVRGSTVGGGLGAADLLLAATPALVALAAGIIASRVFPLAVGVVTRVADRRSDLVPVLALRRASRESGGSPVLIVLVAAAMIATFSAAMLAHLDRAAVDVAWHRTGAPYRVVVDNGSLPSDTALDQVAGVEATAPGYRSRAVRTARAPVELLAVDGAALERVSAGTPAAAGMPAAFGEPSPARPAAIVSGSLATAQGGITVGRPFQVRIAGRAIELAAVQARTTFPTLSMERPFVVVSLPQLRAAYPELAAGATDIFVRAPESAGEGIRGAAAAIAGARVEDRAERTRALREAPVMAAAVTGIAASALMAGAYAALAVAAAIALRGSARIVEAAQLRTLGLSRREAVGLAMAEHGPPTLTAFVVGSVAGVAMFALVRGSVGLAGLIGSALEIPSQLEPTHLLMLLAALVLVAAAGILVGAAAERQATPSTEIRRGFE